MSYKMLCQSNLKIFRYFFILYFFYMKISTCWRQEMKIQPPEVSWIHPLCIVGTCAKTHVNPFDSF